MRIVEFLLARIAEDEAVAKAVPPLDHNYDMGGNRQGEKFTFGRRLGSGMDGMGNVSKHESNPTTEAHFARHDPSRVLAECAAKRAIIANTAKSHGMHADDVGFAWDDANYRDVCALAAVYASHEDYDPDWA